jgi:hypothetical protein
MNPFYRYDLVVEIPATDVAVLVDALEGDDFSLRERLGTHELRRQLEAQELRIEALSLDRWPEFERDIGTLSAFLSEPICGREIHVEPGTGGPLLEGWAILGRRGETGRVALDLAWDTAKQAPVERGIDPAYAGQRWKDLPEWERSLLTARHGRHGRPA